MYEFSQQREKKTETIVIRFSHMGEFSSAFANAMQPTTVTINLLTGLEKKIYKMRG